MSPGPPKDEIRAEVEEEVADLGDPETSSPLPSGALASQAALPIEEVLPGRVVTELPGCLPALRVGS